jgi:hypothetical protein
MDWTVVAGASGKSSSTAASSMSGKGVTMAELGVEHHLQVLDGVRAMSVDDGLK